MTSAAIAGMVATVFGAVMLVPQVVKLRRSGDVAGLSATWVGLGAASNVGWVVYLGRERLLIGAAATALATVFFGIVWVQLRDNGVSMRTPSINAALFALGLAMIGFSLGWTVFGVTMGLTYFVQVAPSLISAYRELQPSGIAPWTWAISFGEGALWMYYGFWHRSVPVMMFSVTAMVAGLLMVARFVATRPTTELAI